jgi:starch synthase (maltosyl-transferring)
MPPPRVYDFGGDSTDSGPAVAKRFGFTHIASNEPFRCLAGDLPVLANVDLSTMPSDAKFVQEHPEWFAIGDVQDCRRTIDPRQRHDLKGRATARYYMAPQEFLGQWTQHLNDLIAKNIQGFRLRNLGRTPPEAWKSLTEKIKTAAPEILFIADIAGLTREALLALQGCGFDYCLSSLAWWDFQQPWLLEEYDAAIQAAPVLSRVNALASPANIEERKARYQIAAITGSGIWMQAEFADDPEVYETVVSTNEMVGSSPILAKTGALQRNDGLLIRTAEKDQRISKEAIVAIINSNKVVSSASETRADWDIRETTPLAPHEVRLQHVRRNNALLRSAPEPDPTSPRVVIGNVSPAVDDGAFPAKRIVGDRVIVEADIFADGHGLIAADVVHNGQRYHMRELDNDRWQASFIADRAGRHAFKIEAWVDEFGTFARDLSRKKAAGKDIGLDLQEGAERMKDALGVSSEEPAVLLAPETAEAMRRTEARQHLAESKTYTIDVDRVGANFASWYELFPRSQSGVQGQHGTFRDVIARLPDISAMGFDVLYFPPIHPIGTTNRKGKNNSLSAGANDPGSVYAIGSAEGGHTEIHPQLGTLDDFRALIAAAREHGMEIALDFAVQCSPDHPWLKKHPGWFDWRADGSIKYAENPPKLYEDIVNVDFYKPEAIPALWQELLSTVLFWAANGVLIFRVDNPHTKPFPFWAWLIENVRAQNPDILFLGEAFTRPKVMYHLAKIGFSQSYTYFTWRNTKQELTQYLQELNAAPVRDFFRPHFFVNTPDINPYFLQQPGRPGFLIRAALAATLSGLWGLYSGFELCEAAALPGREEYPDSEKYEIKTRDWNAPGNIKAEIAQLNRLRKSYSPLQSHLGVTFYNAFNDNILYFGKHDRHDDSRILVAISLNPRGAEGCQFEIPLWEWGLPDSGSLYVEDLLAGTQSVWRGKIQHMHLEPHAPYRIWRVVPAEDQK